MKEEDKNVISWFCCSGHHAGVLCARNNRSQDSKWTEETGDGRESDSKMIFFFSIPPPIFVNYVTHFVHKTSDLDCGISPFLLFNFPPTSH